MEGVSLSLAETVERLCANLYSLHFLNVKFHALQFKKEYLENHTAKDALILFYVHFLLKYPCNIFRKLEKCFVKVAFIFINYLIFKNVTHFCVREMFS